MMTRAEAELANVGHRQGGDLRHLDPLTTLDLSTCVNTRSPHPAIRPAYASMPEVVLHSHPFGVAADFLAAYTAFLGVEADEGYWLAGNGITDFLEGISRILPGGVVVGPEYTQTIELFNAAVPGLAAPDAPERLAQRINHAMSHHPMVVISNPRNPTGAHIPPSVLIATAERHPSTLLVVDEAYVEFLPGQHTLIGVELENVIVLRAPNKVLGAAGLRTGAAWTRNAWLAQQLEEWLHRWPFSGPDAWVTIAALQQPEWISETLAELGMTSAWLHDLLVGTFGEVVASPMHFRFVPLTRPEVLSTVRLLEAQGVAVRAFPDASPGRVPGIRVTAPSLADFPRAEQAFGALAG